MIAKVLENIRFLSENTFDSIPGCGLMRSLHRVPHVLPVALAHHRHDVTSLAPDWPPVGCVRTLLRTAVVELVGAVDATEFRAILYERVCLTKTCTRTFIYKLLSCARTCLATVVATP